jgi:hypothetical protein
MKNIIIVFERPDISSALTLQSRLDNSDAWVFDPHLIDDLAAAGVQRYKYIECELGINVPRFVRNGRTEALSIEHAVETDLQMAVPDAIDCYWQHLNWHFLQSTLQGYTRLWERFLETAYNETHFHVFDHYYPIVVVVIIIIIIFRFIVILIDSPYTHFNLCCCCFVVGLLFSKSWE